MQSHQSVMKYTYTYAIISWWCRMHAFNFPCKSQFAIALSCSFCSPWWDVICCCLIFDMAAFTFSNWLQATAMNVVTRDGKPQVIPTDKIDVKHCKEGYFTNYICVKFIHLCNSSDILSADSNDFRDISIQIYVTNLTPITFGVSFINRNITTEWIDVTFWCYRICNSLHWKRQQFGTFL
jgi:hypothetical protein